jgi:hypothetical protein
MPQHVHVEIKSDLFRSWSSFFLLFLYYSLSHTHTLLSLSFEYWPLFYTMSPILSQFNDFETAVSVERTSKV